MASSPRPPGITVEEYADSADAFVASTTHPTNGRLFRDCAYLPMVELLRYLEANGFTAVHRVGR